MKKFLVSLIVVFMLMLLPSPVVAFADSQTNTDTGSEVSYYKVSKTAKVYFYQKEGYNFMLKFEVPNTYYLKQIPQQLPESNITGDKIYVPVMYKGISGYINQDDITNKNVEVASFEDLTKLNEDNAYYNKTVNLKIPYSLTNGTIIDTDANLIYLGKMQITNDAININDYVFNYNNSIVNIPFSETYFDAINPSTHTFPVDNNTDTIISGESNSPYNKLSTNILTVGIAVACVAMVIIIYKPRKKDNRREEYYEDNDYYENYKNHYRTRNKR